MELNIANFTREGQLLGFFFMADVLFNRQVVFWICSCASFLFLSVKKRQFQTFKIENCDLKVFPQGGVKS